MRDMTSERCSGARCSCTGEMTKVVEPDGRVDACVSLGALPVRSEVSVEKWFAVDGCEDECVAVSIHIGVDVCLKNVVRCAGEADRAIRGVRLRGTERRPDAGDERE